MAAGRLTQASARMPDNKELTVRLACVLTFARDYPQGKRASSKKCSQRFRPKLRKYPAICPLCFDQRLAGRACHLLKLRERRPKDPAVLIDLVRAFAGMSDAASATGGRRTGSAARRGRRRETRPGRHAPRFRLRSNRRAAVFNQVLAAKPTKRPGSNWLGLGTFIGTNRSRCLNSWRSSVRRKISGEPAVGEYFQQVGQYTEATSRSTSTSFVTISRWRGSAF